MAEVNRTVRGKPIEDWLAHTRMVRAALKEEAAARAEVAEGLLAAHHHDGHAQIELQRGDLDWYVILSDERGLKAAMSIEYGRRGPGGMAGLFILHRAFAGGR